MSQKVSTRKSAVTEDKPRQTDSPVKDMKKKMAANAEKEKQAAEKAEKPAEKQAEKSKPAEKPAESKKTEKEKQVENKKPAEKQIEKNAKTEKQVEKGNTSAEKDKKDKGVDKKDTSLDKSKEESKGEKSDKQEKSEEKDKKKQEKSKQNGQKAHNGVSDVTLNSNGQTEDILNGAVGADSEDEVLVIDDNDQDELFPELTYDDTSDGEWFEPAAADAAQAHARARTRREQVKASRTPETPQPATAARADAAAEQSKDGKVLKLAEAPPTDRKLRSADSPKPDSKKDKEQKDTSKSEEKTESPKKESEKESSKPEVEIVVEMEIEEATEAAEAPEEAEGASRKPDTNYSKSRVKVSPYRRSTRLADQTASSVMANYTGNNTTMEMDITESSIADGDDSVVESPYAGSVRSIRGRRSYRQLHDLRELPRTPRPPPTLHADTTASRPTGTVVGRKRKPEGELSVVSTLSALSAVSSASAMSVSVAEEADEAEGASVSKRVRLLDRLSRATHSLTEIVGINTDLPLTSPVASEPFDPETLKASRPAPSAPSTSAIITSATPTRDSKKCVVM